MNVDIDLVVEVTRLAEYRRTGTNIAESCSRRLLHDVAELTSNLQSTTTRKDRRLDYKELSSLVRPSKSRCETNLVKIL